MKYTILKAGKSVRFHLKHGLFNFSEQFSDLTSGIAGFLLFPFYIWLITKLWEKFNAYQGNYTLQEILLYIGITEILFMTFLSPTSLSRSSADFSLSLARPRSWLGMSFSGLYGRCLGSRITYIIIFIIIMPLFGIKVLDTLNVAIRLCYLLPFLGIVQAMFGLGFASGQVLWAETSYFVIPVSKIFLALGGVFGPLTDFGESWRTVLLKLPPSDIFFQPAHYCIKGEFYHISKATWAGRIVAICFFLWIANLLFYRQARLHHQGYGG